MSRFMAAVWTGLFAMLALAGASSAAQTTITWLVNEHSTLIHAWEGIAAEYERRHPDVHIDLIVSSGEGSYQERMLAMNLAGTLPDVVSNGSTDLVEAGAFLDLRDLMQTDPSFEALAASWVPGARAGTRLGKDRYVMPYAVVTNITYINTDHFAEVGLALPSDDWDWAEYRADAQRLTRRDANGQVTRWGLMPVTTNTHRFLIPWVYQAGGRLFDDMYEPTVSEFSSDATRAAFEFVYDLRWKEHVVPHPGEPSRNFLQGGTSMWQQLPARMAQLAQVEGLKWDIRRLPGDLRRANMSGFDYIYINKAAQHPDLAWDFIKFVTSPPAQALYAPYGQIPISLEVVSSPEWRNFPVAGLNKAAFVDELAVAVNREITPKYQNEITRIYKEEWGKAYDRNEVPVAQALGEIDRRIAALLD